MLSRQLLALVHDAMPKLWQRATRQAKTVDLFPRFYKTQTGARFWHGRETPVTKVSFQYYTPKGLQEKTRFMVGGGAHPSTESIQALIETPLALDKAAHAAQSLNPTSLLPNLPRKLQQKLLPGLESLTFSPTTPNPHLASDMPLLSAKFKTLGENDPWDTQIDWLLQTTKTAEPQHLARLLETHPKKGTTVFAIETNAQPTTTLFRQRPHSIESLTLDTHAQIPALGVPLRHSSGQTRRFDSPPPLTPDTFTKWDEVNAKFQRFTVPEGQKLPKPVAASHRPTLPHEELQALHAQAPKAAQNLEALLTYPPGATTLKLRAFELPGNANDTLDNLRQQFNNSQTDHTLTWAQHWEDGQPVIHLKLVDKN